MAPSPTATQLLEPPLLDLTPELSDHSAPCFLTAPQSSLSPLAWPTLGLARLPSTSNQGPPPPTQGPLLHKDQPSPFSHSCAPRGLRLWCWRTKQSVSKTLRVGLIVKEAEATVAPTLSRCLRNAGGGAEYRRGAHLPADCRLYGK